MSSRPGLLTFLPRRNEAIFVWHNVRQCSVCDYRVFVNVDVGEHDGVCDLRAASALIVKAYDEYGENDDRFEKMLEENGLIALPSPGTNFVQKIVLG